MTIFLDSFDVAPVRSDFFPFEFNQWLAVLVDTLNELSNTLQDSLNLLTAQSYTASEITALTPQLSNGIILYDSTNNVYVGMQSGSLVKFTTAAYP